MRTLVLGGIRSGKSRWAEQAIQAAAEAPSTVTYVATAPVREDPEFAARIAGHRERRPAAWRTVESADVAEVLRRSPAPTLVDDVGNWLTTAMDQREAWQGGSVVADVEDLVDAVAQFTQPLVLVSPEVGLTVVPATPAGRLFTDALGTLNQRLAAVCDRVVLVVAGLPLTVKPAGQ
ncbi:bifunctional adenosylcobinamide kinase/adenosylcobinamide-phosphate guanylyltransferase [Mycolicibacterium confluentis]|uniref:Adenosylcobinamide kinase n=1 Tax=Mycolicibacterium confluentis TaxID=28047 RepID=A0A7I7XWB4_9MYCO|nr:bifunctional adenosylcobinamide kinase/adenosylcobinamide-phosphate guanylyltransferase [Mycolicibacterium confluentis]MCV7317987.1 bifunctional adenosylcobinamide kinase/adenosylcobinamide-phosphate guanylyltransferase [Mycolicibacterium confluentis]ORV32578.1 adenosylcobinamide kinase/adenosylcobinamide phosphate guanyltransferase [Mycolicibacterium confluentis]BBZ33152.1 adenosylcobinamide kinase [Mycolicibacterium confluentis]